MSVQVPLACRELCFEVLLFLQVDLVCLESSCVARIKEATDSNVSLSNDRKTRNETQCAKIVKIVSFMYNGLCH